MLDSIRPHLPTPPPQTTPAATTSRSSFRTTIISMMHKKELLLWLSILMGAVVIIGAWIRWMMVPVVQVPKNSAVLGDSDMHQTQESLNGLFQTLMSEWDQFTRTPGAPKNPILTEQQLNELTQKLQANPPSQNPTHIKKLP